MKTEKRGGGGDWDRWIKINDSCDYFSFLLIYRLIEKKKLIMMSQHEERWWGEWNIENRLKEFFLFSSFSDRRDFFQEILIFWIIDFLSLSLAQILSHSCHSKCKFFSITFFLNFFHYAIRSFVSCPYLFFSSAIPHIIFFCLHTKRGKEKSGNDHHNIFLKIFLILSR